MIPTISALAAALIGDIHLHIPAELAEIPADIAHAVASGDTAPLRQHVAAALDDAVDLSGLPLVGGMAEEAQSQLATDLVDRIAGKVADGLTTGAVSVGGRSRALALQVVSSPEEAAAVLAMGPIWRMAHPALVRAARALQGA